MKIREISIRNFKPYRKTKISFPQKGNKNVYLIIGDNGKGKTSLHEAINWCLYGGSGARSNFTQYYNDKAKANKENEMWVQLEFNHNGHRYSLTREADKFNYKRKHAEENIKLNIDGNGFKPGNIEEIQEKIEGILPEEISRFFLFDGEKIQELAKQQGGQEIKEEIELLLGLKTLQNTEDDLKEMEKFYSKKVQNVEEELDKADEVKGKLSKKRKKLDELEDSLENMENKRAMLKETSEEYWEEIKEFGSDPEKKINKIENLRDKKDEKKQEIIEQQDKLRKSWRELYKIILVPVVENEMKNINEEIKELDEKITKIIYYNSKKEIIKNSINKSECEICDRQISNTEKLQGKIKKLDGDDSVEDLQEKLSKLKNMKNKLDKIETNKKLEPAQIKAKIENLERRCDEIDQKIQNIHSDLGASTEEIEDLKENKEELDEKISKLNGKIEKKKEDKKQLNEQIDNLEKELRNLSEDEKHAELMDKKSLTKKCMDVVERIRLEYISKKRDNILNEANRVFQKLTDEKRGYKGFDLEKDTFNFQLIDMEENKPNMGEIASGEKEIVSLSFILGLNKYAPYLAPIVMDTPVARLDLTYRKNLARLLAESEGQKILLVTDAELIGVKEMLKQYNSIGETYEIKRNWDKRESDIKKEKLGVI